MSPILVLAAPIRSRRNGRPIVYAGVIERLDVVICGVAERHDVVLQVCGGLLVGIGRRGGVALVQLKGNLGVGNVDVAPHVGHRLVVIILSKGIGPDERSFEGLVDIGLGLEPLGERHLATARLVLE